MKVEVNLHTTLQRQTPQGTQRCVDLELPEGSTLEELLVVLEIRLEPENLLLVVNGKVADDAYRLADGDHVSLIPAMSGG
jgi:molybdopterin converting factor small subunit